MILLSLTQQYVFTAITCLLTGYIPSVSTEIILASLGLIIPLKHAIPLAAVGALCQTIAKLHLYFLAKKLIPCLKYKSKKKLVRLKIRFKSREKLSSSIIFISALTGLPPYYFINLLCGLLNTGWQLFCLLGFSGMFIRFAICLCFPQLILAFFKA